MRTISINDVTVLPDGKIRVHFVIGDKDAMPKAGKTGTIFESRAALQAFVSAATTDVPDELLLASAMKAWLSSDPALTTPALARGGFTATIGAETAVVKERV